MNEKLKNYLSIFLSCLIAISFSGLIIWGIYSAYRNWRVDNAVKEKQRINQEQEYKQIEKDNAEYIKTILPLCLKPVKDISAIDFYRCKEIGKETPGVVLSLKSLLDKPNLPAFCQRKIAELTANEMSECLVETTNTTGDPINDLFGVSNK